MKISFLRSSILVAVSIQISIPIVAAPLPLALLHSLFDPSTNTQSYVEQGWSAAVEGNIAVVGSPYSDTSGENDGVVKVYNATNGALLHILLNPEPASGDLFGKAVAVSGNLVVVGKSGDNAIEQRPGEVYVFDLSSVTPTVPTFTFTNPVAKAPSVFGYSVAVSGNRVVVGAPYDDAGATDAGSVYVYDLNSATPVTPIASLRNPNPAFDDRFGWSVAISGNRVVAGVVLDNTGAEDAGCAYVFDLSHPNPSMPMLTLTNPAPAAYEQFGFATGLSGDHLVIGARYDLAERGSAYVYNLAAATPAVPVTTLTNPAPGGNFGFSVSVSGSRAVVGAPVNASGAPSSGVAYVYELSTSPPSPVATLNNPLAGPGDYFGWSASISGTRIIVGAPNDDTAGSDAGSAYLYDLAGVRPTSTYLTINDSGPSPADFFGSSAAVAGSWCVIGAPADNTGAPDAGRVYIYNLSGSNPRTPSFVLSNPSPAMSDRFGHALAISGTRLVVGAPYDDTGSHDSGIAYVYDLAGASPTQPAFILNNPSPSIDDRFGWSVAISGTRAVVGAYSEDAGGIDRGGAYVYDLTGAASPAPSVSFVNPGPENLDYFGYAVAISGTRVVVGAFGDADAGNNYAGAAYFYDLAGPAPNLPVHPLLKPDLSAFDNFGIAVAVSDRYALVTAKNGGRVLVYDLTGITPQLPSFTITNPSPAAIGFGEPISVSGTRVVVGTKGGGLAHVYDLSSDTPAVSVSMLSAPGTITGDGFGSSVAIDGTSVVIGAPFDDTNGESRGASYVFGLVPELRITATAAGFARISWMPTASAFTLQWSDNLAPDSWVNVPGAAVSPVTIPMTNAARFYRLVQP